MERNKVLALKEGDYRVFNDVFEAYWNKVYIYLVKKTKNSEVAKDLTQLVFIKLWKYRQTLSDQIGLNEQIFRKTKQIFIDWLRQELRNRNHIMAVDNLPQAGAILANEENLETKRDIYIALQTLPPKRKQIFELKHIHGYSYKEIAAALKISVKTVDNQLTKANLQLRKLLQISVFTAIGIDIINNVA